MKNKGGFDVRRVLTLALVAAMMMLGWARAEQAALDAFHALLEAPEEVENQTAVELLDALMAGRFDTSDEGAVAALSGIASRDITAYAAEHAMLAGQVRNAWYKALADALGKRAAVDPDSEAQYKNAMTILSLFMKLDGAPEEAQREAIRSQMNPEAVQRIAGESGLPEAFVEFIIMSPNWNDDSWENDEDWRKLCNWAEAFSEITVGSRDSDGSTRIADLQALLISLGYLKGKADGVFGPRTQAALIEFQMANGLPATGVYDAVSASRIQSADAVARWSYGDDFWDSKDFDTAETSKGKDTPDTPDEKKDDDKKKDTPDTPGEKKGKKNDTPDTPDDKKTGRGRDTPDSPDSPD